MKKAKTRIDSVFKKYFTGFKRGTTSYYAHFPMKDLADHVVQANTFYAFGRCN